MESRSAGVGRGLRWWQQDGCVADRRRRSADHSRLGAALQRPRTGRAGRWEDHRAHPRSSTPITAAHWRRLLRPARSRRSTPSCAGGARTWRGGSWRRCAMLARRDHGRARVEGARLRQDLGAAAPLRAKRTLAVEAFKKNFPAELAKIRARLPKGVEIELWWQDEARIGQKNAHTPMGQTWHALAGAPRPAHRMGLYLRRDLSREGERRRAGRCPGATPTPWRRTSSRSVPPSIPAPMRCARRSGRLALDAQAGNPRQHHRPGAAVGHDRPS